MRVKAVLFDKDGTLFDFQKTWASWIGQEVRDLAQGDATLEAEIAAAIGYDARTGQVLPESLAIAGTETEVAALLLPFMPGGRLDDLVAKLRGSAADLVPVEVTPLVPFLAQLAAMDLYLGVATNDSESTARRHLRHHGVADMFDFIVGYDSGHGAKPGPGMCSAFSEICRLDPAEIVMVGDSRHDLDAGRAAGMRSVAVLTGVASAADLAGHADVVLADIGELPGWIRAQG